MIEDLRTHFAGFYFLSAAGECLHSVQDIVVNGQATSAISYDKARLSLKFTNMNFTYTDGVSGPMSLCFTLDEKGACPDLTLLCGGR